MLDPALCGFVDATDQAEADLCMARILEEQSEPLIRKIAARKLSAHGGPGALSREDLEDITADALLALVSRLQSLRADPASEPIESFTDYTATVAYNTFAYYLRRRHPGRSRLKNRLRYVLTRDRRFGLWSTPEGLVCGRAGWRPGSASRAATDRLDQLGTEPERWLRWARKGRAPRADLAALVSAVLQAIDGPVDFDRLVGTIAGLSSPERHDQTLEPGALAAIPDETSPPADLAYERKRFTERLWREVHLLPLRQRISLLLSLRDARGSGVLWLVPLTGVASIRQIARTLAMPDLELAEIWSRLPLDDRAIAERLGCTRQQVINLRSAARKRLANRLEDGGAGDGPLTQANKPGVSASLEDEP